MVSGISSTGNNVLKFKFILQDSVRAGILADASKYEEAIKAANRQIARSICMTSS